MRYLLALGLGFVLAWGFGSMARVAFGAEPGAMIPPVRFDHAFAGRVTVTNGSELQTRNRCRMMFPYGCSTLLTPTHCQVYAVGIGEKAGSQTITASFHAAIVRHETGHCNGWPAHHPGARFLGRT
jgi:hypothetical protein